MTTIYTIVLNSLTIGFFSDELNRDEAFDKYVRFNLKKENSFFRGSMNV